MNIIKNKSGYIALLAVFIIMTTGVIIGVSMSLNGISELTLSYNNYQSVKAFNLADACAEEALINLKRDGASYSGDTLNFDSDYCTITISGTGATRTAEIVGIVKDKFNRKINLEVTITPSFAVDAWEEVGEF